MPRECPPRSCSRVTLSITIWPNDRRILGPTSQKSKTTCFLNVQRLTRFQLCHSEFAPISAANDSSKWHTKSSCWNQDWFKLVIQQKFPQSFGCSSGTTGSSLLLIRPSNHPQRSLSINLGNPTCWKFYSISHFQWRRIRPILRFVVDQSNAWESCHLACAIRAMEFKRPKKWVIVFLQPKGIMSEHFGLSLVFIPSKKLTRKSRKYSVIFCQRSSGWFCLTDLPFLSTKVWTFHHLGESCVTHFLVPWAKAARALYHHIQGYLGDVVCRLWSRELPPNEQCTRTGTRELAPQPTEREQTVPQKTPKPIGCLGCLPFLPCPELASYVYNFWLGCLCLQCHL